MQRHLYLCLFLFGLLALVSLVDSYVVLSPQDVSRLGREVHQQQAPQVAANDVEPEDTKTERNPFTLQENSLVETEDSGHGMLVRIALGGERATKSTLQRKPSASHFSLVRIVRSEPFILAQDEVSVNRESAAVTAAEIPSSSHRSLRVHHVLSRMSHALKELISNHPLTQTVTDKAEDLVAIQTRRMASKPIMRRSRPFNSKMHDETSEEIQNAISFDKNEVDQKLYRYREKDINHDVKTEADMTDLGEDVESVSDVAPPPPTVGTTLRPIREEDETEAAKQLEKENDFRHHGHHHHHEKDGERHHDSWYRRMDACQSDISKFCGLRPTYSNHDFGAVECLSQHKSELSSQCIEALSSSTIFQCAADARAFCSESLVRNDKFRHEYQKHRIIDCLESKVQVLSANCLTAINNRRSRHDSEGDDYSSVAPPSDPKPPRHASSENESSHGGKGLKWAVIPIVGLSAALVFTAILAVVILVQRKRRRQQQAVLEAANSLNIPPPPTDIVAAQTIRVTEEVSMAPMAMPYYRMDDAQAV